ncbi:hypothetical protein [Deinococcus detaillensis]|nr:hypothetical protein [Deinococcus detaillensis]
MLARWQTAPLHTRVSRLFPVGVIVLVLVMHRALPLPDSPFPLAYAALFDATVTASALVWWLTPKASRRPKQLMMVAAQGVALCVLAFPALRHLLWLELGGLGLAGWQAYMGWRQPLPADFAERDDLERAYLWWERLSLRPRLFRMVVFEMTLLSHLVRRPRFAAGRQFGTRKDATTGGMLGMLLFLNLVEGWLSHLLLSHWNLTAAWLWTNLNIMVAVWLLAYGRALALRPVTISQRRLYLRSGLHWTLSVPRSEMLEASLLTAQDTEAFNLAIDNPPNVRLTFRRPLTLLGIYGTERQVSAVKLHLDDPKMFLTCLAEGIEQK